MINVKTLFGQTTLDESVGYGRCRHIFEDGDITFADIRDMLMKIFSGELEMHEKVDGATLYITYRDGEFKYAVDKTTFADPVEYLDLYNFVEVPDVVREAFFNSIKDIKNAFQTIPHDRIAEYFENGENFLNCRIIYPPCENIIDYGNRCAIVLDGFVNVNGTISTSDNLFAELSKNDALRQSIFEISKPSALKLKNTVLAKQTLDEMLPKLEKFIDGLGWKCTINKYILDKYSRYIVNRAREYGIDVSRDSDFVNYLSARLSQVSGHKPTKSDLATYAKRDGIRCRTDEYRTFIDALERDSDQTNAEIIKPIEDFIIAVGIALMKNITGFMSADVSKKAKRAYTRLDQTIIDAKAGEYELSRDRIRKFKQNLARLSDYAESIPSGGIIVTYKGHAYKLTGSFSAAKEIMNILGVT